MPLPVDVRQMHINDLSAQLIDAKDRLNRLLSTARSDTLTVMDRNILGADLVGLWDQIVEISSTNRAGLDRLEHADGEETSAADLAA